jgi:uncharacterized protein YydD (DUF2326 family)
MNHDERIDELRFYESEWLKENGLHLEERAKRLQLELEIEALKLENQKLKTLASQTEQIPSLKQERNDLQAELIGLKKRLMELSTLETLKHELESKTQELLAVQRRVSRESFWQDVAREFAEQIEDFPTIYGSKTQDSDKTILAALEEWHLEIKESMTDALESRGTSEQLSKTRKLLIAQWVLLRWFEITGVVQ